MSKSTWEDTMRNYDSLGRIKEIHNESERRPMMRRTIKIVELETPVVLEDGQEIKWFGIDTRGRMAIWPFLDDDDHSEYRGNYGYPGASSNLLCSNRSVDGDHLERGLEIIKEYISLREQGESP